MVYHRRKHCIHNSIRDIRWTGQHHQVFHILSKKTGDSAIFKSNYNNYVPAWFVYSEGSLKCHNRTAKLMLCVEPTEFPIPLLPRLKEWHVSKFAFFHCFRTVHPVFETSSLDLEQPSSLSQMSPRLKPRRVFYDFLYVRNSF